MQQKRGVLCLNDAPFCALKQEIQTVQRLVFDENEPLLPQAQQALWQLRCKCDWVCIAAEGEAALVALALAAQLPVERLALMGRWRSCSKKMARFRAYALRNLPLVIANVLLIAAGDEEIAALLRGRRHGELCVLAAQRWQDCANLLTAPWSAVLEKNLLNSMKCV